MKLFKLVILILIISAALFSYEQVVEFYYLPLLDDRIGKEVEVQSVSIAGTFNNWDKTADIFSKNEEGNFYLKKKLNRGLHYYKIVINDDIWLEDLNADLTLRKDDGTGMENYNSGILIEWQRPDYESMQFENIPEWAEEAVWYQIFPERFRNGDKSNDPKLKDINEGNIRGWKIRDWDSEWYERDDWEKDNYDSIFQSIFRRRYGGDLQGIIDKLDYLKDLGITAIYLNPVFRSPSLHKYDGSSFHHIEETFGPDPEGDRKLIEEANETEDPATWIWTSADKLFLRLVEEIHKRDMRIIIDGVFNHSGRLFFAFQDILKNGKNSRYKNWYEITEWNDYLKDGFKYKGWYGVDSLPEFKRDETNLNSETKEYIFNITKRWMAPFGEVEKGVDGWRLDVAFCLPHNFWKEWRKVVKSINSDAYITAEVVDIAPEYLQGDEFDALMNYPFAFAVTEFFIDKQNKLTVEEFDKKLKELREIYPNQITRIMQNLISSHDTPRLRTLINNPDMNYRDWGTHFQNSKVEYNSDYNIESGDEYSKAIHKLIALFKMTYIGAPMIYYGDEKGMPGANDPDCRMPMLWSDINDNKIEKDLFEHYRKLIHLRNDNIALRKGNFETFYIDNEKDIYGFVRKYKQERVYVILNNSNNEISIGLDATHNNNKQLNDILNEGKTYKPVNGKYNILLKPKWAGIYK